LACQSEVAADIGRDDVQQQRMGTADRAGASGSRTKLVLLGTGGGPVIDKNQTRTGPASVVLVDGVAYLVDCGEGAPRQLIRAGLRLGDVDHVFITHQHFDHNSDLGNFLAYAWFAGRRNQVHVWGPPRLEGLLGDYIRMNEFDFRLREAETGRSPFDPIPVAHELDPESDIKHRAVEILVDERVSISAIRVNHGMIPSVAYRFRTPDRDIVFSGDRGGQDDIAGFSRGADVLVHEVLHYEAMVQTYPNAPEAVLKHYREDHTFPEDVGRVATEAGVKKLVLNHILPDNDLVPDDEWIRLVSKTFDGEIVLGTDLVEA
jgi:ribonuclease BN (tRNA processing enzyme)